MTSRNVINTTAIMLTLLFTKLRHKNTAWTDIW